jgi:hypothetical protein
VARPAFKPTNALRRRVSIAAGAGMSHQDIAIGLGISRPTLEKHFMAELSVGANARRLEILEVMHQTAKKGNVAAQKAFLAMTPQLAAPPARVDATDDAQPQGKKAAALVAAQTAGKGTPWAEVLDDPNKLN